MATILPFPVKPGRSPQVARQRSDGSDYERLRSTLLTLPGVRDPTAAKLARYASRNHALLCQQFPEGDKAKLQRCAKKLARVHLIIESAEPAAR